MTEQVSSFSHSVEEFVSIDHLSVNVNELDAGSLEPAVPFLTPPVLFPPSVVCSILGEEYVVVKGVGSSSMIV